MERKFTIFALFYFAFEGKFQVQAPRGGLYSEGRFNGRFFALRIWGAYIWRGLFSEFYGNMKRGASWDSSRSSSVYTAKTPDPIGSSPVNSRYTCSINAFDVKAFLSEMMFYCVKSHKKFKILDTFNELLRLALSPSILYCKQS